MPFVILYFCEICIDDSEPEPEFDNTEVIAGDTGVDLPMGNIVEEVSEAAQEKSQVREPPILFVFFALQPHYTLLSNF